MTAGQDRLDEILTAATDWREELAREIRERATALSEEVGKLQDAASALDGKAPVTKDNTQDEVKLLKKQLEELGGELNQAKMEARRAEQRAERTAQDAQGNVIEFPPDAPTVLLRKAGRADNPVAQLVFSLPSEFREGLTEKAGEPFKVMFQNGRVIFEAADVPAKPAEEVVPRPKLVPPAVSEEAVRDEAMRRKTFTVKELAQHFEVPYPTVYKIIRKLVAKKAIARAGTSFNEGFAFVKPEGPGPREQPRGEPDMKKLGVGADRAASNIVPHTRPRGSSGKPGRDKKIARATGRQPLRRGEKR